MNARFQTFKRSEILKKPCFFHEDEQAGSKLLVVTTKNIAKPSRQRVLASRWHIYRIFSKLAGVFNFIGLSIKK